MSTAWTSSTAYSPPARATAAAVPDTALSSLVYQSRAATPQSDHDLEQLVAAARERNRAEGLTGVLVYDEGRFLQWLEGPTDGLRRVWRSICQDPRHTAVSLMAAAPAQNRLFGGFAMVLAMRRNVDGDRSGGIIELPVELVQTLYQHPAAAPSMLAVLSSPQAEPGIMSLADLVHDVVIPKLVQRRVPWPAAPLRIDPHAEELARLLVGVEPEAATALIDRLRDGRPLAQLCAGLFAPAARAMGELWQSDDCSEWQVAMGLGRLQLALRIASQDGSGAVAAPLPSLVPHAVLVAPSPLEEHVLGSVMASELFLRAGWEVSCEYPNSDAVLSQLVHDHWFDVLDLSLSVAFTREHRLTKLASSILAARAHSLNPALVVIVDGRVFHQRPWEYAKVGADAGSGSVMDVVITAQRQLQRLVKPKT